LIKANSKFKVTVAYVYTLEAIVEARSEAEALENFNQLPTDETKETMLGRLEDLMPVLDKEALQVEQFKLLPTQSLCANCGKILEVIQEGRCKYCNSSDHLNPSMLSYHKPDFVQGAVQLKTTPMTLLEMWDDKTINHYKELL